VKGIARSDWDEYICNHYTLKGKDQNGQSHKAR
jgi:hypothetical protein